MAIPDHVVYIAAQLHTKFIPKNPAAIKFDFQFTMVPNTTYRVTYSKKTEKGSVVWVLDGYQEIVEEK